MRTLAKLVIALVLGIIPAAAQSISGNALPAVFIGSIHSAVPSSGEGDWMLQVISRGGLTGGGTGDLIIGSTGRVSYVGGTGPERMTKMTADELGPLTLRINGMDRSHWAIGSRLGHCSDCVATLLVLTLREADGIHTYTAFWDPTTRAGIASDVLEIHALATGRIR